MSLEGRLDDLSLADMFQIISLSKRSGVLTVVRKEGTGRLVFSLGQLVHASSDTKSRLGYNLVKNGTIRNEELEEALRLQKTEKAGVPLGTVLVQMGAISQKALEQAIREHLLEVVKDILTWDQGTFLFELSGGVQNNIVFFDGLKTDFLILEAARRQDEALRDERLPTGPGGSPDRMPAPSLGPEAIDLVIGEEIAPPSKGGMQAPPRGGQTPEKGPVFGSSLPQRDLVLLNSMIEELYTPSSGSEITLLILRYASELMARAVVFLVREEDILGLGQFGLGISSPDEQIQAVMIPISEPSVFQEVVEKRVSYKGRLSDGPWHRYFLDQIGGGTPCDIFVAPLISDGQVIALLYGDNLPTQREIGDTEGLEIFIKVAGVAFQKAILDRKLSDKSVKKTG